ncbi:MAG: hypothetical protein IKT27_00695, partial [Clostridia bacterium]|nr:hypothetical protein [Clostridia bacterium]
NLKSRRILAKNFQPKYRLGGRWVPSQCDGQRTFVASRVPEAPCIGRRQAIVVFNHYYLRLLIAMSGCSNRQSLGDLRRLMVY